MCLTRLSVVPQSHSSAASKRVLCVSRVVGSAPSRLTSVFPEKGRGYVLMIKAAVRRRGVVEAVETINVALHALER